MEPSQLQSAPQQAKLWEMKFTSLKKKKKKIPNKRETREHLWHPEEKNVRNQGGVELMFWKAAIIPLESPSKRTYECLQ